MKEQLNKLRKQIDNLDNRLINILEKRLEISKQIGRYKLKNGLLVKDKQREKEIIKLRMRKWKLSKKFIRGIFNLIFRESKKVQKRIVK